MSSNKTYQIFPDKMGGVHVENFIGHAGMLFWAPETGELRIGTGNTAGGISLFKELAYEFGVTTDGGGSTEGFNILTYDGGNASSNDGSILDGNTSVIAQSFNQSNKYTFSNTITFNNDIYVNGVRAAGSLGTNGQILTSTGYNVVWKDAPMSSSGGSVANNTTLNYDYAGSSVVANSDAAVVSVANAAAFTISNFSGMLIVNDHYAGGVALYIAGGGQGVLVSNTTSAFDTSLTENGTGYDWFNSTNLTGPFTFTVIKTRNTA
jgi:hypothetical protein